MHYMQGKNQHTANVANRTAQYANVETGQNISEFDGFAELWLANYPRVPTVLPRRYLTPPGVIEYQCGWPIFSLERNSDHY